MYSVNPFGNSTLSCNAVSRTLFPECPWIARRYRNWLEEFGFKQNWNLFFAPPPVARTDVHSSSNHCEASSNFFSLHSSMMSLYWIAPSLPRRTVWSCRSNRVLASETSKHCWSCDRCVSMSIHLLSRTGIEIEVSVIVGFGRGLAFAMGFPKPCSLLPCSALFLSRICQPRLHSNPRYGLNTKQRWNLNFNTASVFMITNFYVQDGAEFSLPRIHPLTRVPSSFRGFVYSRLKCCIFWSFGTSRVLKSCPISTRFKPASEHNLDNVWSSDNCSIVRSYYCIRFPRCCSLAWVYAIEGPAGVSVLSK